jgi:predicted acyltransferase
MSDLNDPAPPHAQPSRLVSLDAFRGLTIAGMVLVNNPGSGRSAYAPLRHAEWDGFTPTDLVFPSFLLIAGVAIPLALGKRLARGEDFGSIAGKVFRRSLIIFALGLFLNGFPFTKPVAEIVSGIRIPGVLQRIAICYLAASLIYLKTSVRTQVLIILALLFGYWAAMTLIPVPGIGAGDLSKPNNLAAWIDRGLLPGHIYRKEYDPEGLLSTLPAIATTLIGVLSGTWLASKERSIVEKVSGVFAAGVLLFWAGCAWGLVFPINKALWSSSFTLFTAGLSLQALGLCAWLMEVEGIRRWSWPFVVFGSNAIAAYVLSGVGARVMTMVKVTGTSGQSITLKDLVTGFFTSWADPSLASLLYSLSYVLLWLVVLAVLYRLKVFIRV